MIGLWHRFQHFDRPAQVLMINQFTINLGFYMLMPYLAGYLSGSLAMAAWTVGLVLGVRNFAQQGMFLVGGTLADRFGYKPLIVAGCLIRTVGFALLAVASSVPAIIAAAAATGFAGALFNPAVRAYLAADAGAQRVEAFAVFNVFYQAGILAGPLIGLALTALDFRLTATVAAAVFAVLTVMQLLALPADRDERRRCGTSVMADWRAVVGNHRFVLFALAMTGTYVLSFQVYLALPMQAAAVAGQWSATTLVAAVFAVTGAVAIIGQLRITRWCARRLDAMSAVAAGTALMAVAFCAPLVAGRAGYAGAAAVLVCAAVLAMGQAAVFPFEMDLIVRLAHDRLVATHYGLYNTIVGVGILVGNLAIGTGFGVARDAGLTAVVWAALVVAGLCWAGLLIRLRHGAVTEPAPAARRAVAMR